MPLPFTSRSAGVRILVFLLILPILDQFLLRTFAWRIVLAPEGTLSQTLRELGIISRPLLILDTNAAVQLGIVYNYLPVMILPMYVALSRIDRPCSAPAWISAPDPAHLSSM